MTIVNCRIKSIEVSSKIQTEAITPKSGFLNQLKFCKLVGNVRSTNRIIFTNQIKIYGMLFYTNNQLFNLESVSGHLSIIYNPRSRI